LALVAPRRRFTPVASAHVAPAPPEASSAQPAAVETGLLNLDTSPWSTVSLRGRVLGQTPLLGVAFGLGWAPCIGPTLSAVLALSLTEGSQARGVVLAIAYCLGLGIPFLLLAFGSAGAVRGLGWLRRHTRTIQIFGGALLIVVGVALVTGVWADFISWVRDAFVSDVRLPI
jgi:cytochrome c-type biogenesis protein